MTPIWWTNTSEIPNLGELQLLLKNHGGRVIQYQRVLSVIFFCRWESVLEWVAPGRSRFSVGLEQAALCGTIGWWSMPGLFWTPAAIVQNLAGGVDVTVLVKSASSKIPPPIPTISPQARVAPPPLPGAIAPATIPLSVAERPNPEVDSQEFLTMIQERKRSGDLRAVTFLLTVVLYCILGFIIVHRIRS